MRPQRKTPGTKKMSTQDKTTKFEENKVYYARSICDYDTIIRVKIKRITPKMVKYVELDMWGDEAVKSRKFVQHETYQTFSAGAGFTVSSNNLSEPEERPKKIEPEEIEAEVTVHEQSALGEYGNKEILITMHCPVKGHKIARLMSIDMFLVPYYDAIEDWECDIITADEGKRIELINRWICERANEQHESILEFVKYEIVDEGTLSEYYLNWQFKQEAEKQSCEPVAEFAVEAEQVYSGEANSVSEVPTNETTYTDKEENRRQSTKNIVAALKESSQDFEYYPTTQEMLDCIHRDMRRGTDKDEAFTVLDVGAGTASAGKFLAGKERVFAVEKSEILRANWPCDVIPVGTDFDNLSIIGIKAEVCFCNPPYSTYETWAARIINEFSGGRIYLVIPKRWENSDLIKLAIEDRKASSKVIFSGDFLEAERSARAKVDIVCIDLRQAEWGSRQSVKVDPFELWYKKEFKQEPEQAQEEQEINVDIDEKNQIVAGESYIDRISSLYSAELVTLQQSFQSINGLSGKVFKLLNLSRGTLCEALKTEINGIRTRYWNELFKKYKPISSRLTSHGLKCLRGQFSAQESIDFTVDNILTATVWAIKYANEMNSEQLEVFVLQLFDKANIKMYKSNQRTFEKEDWRYSKHEKAKSYSHYGLDYRIVLDQVMPFPYREGFNFSYDYPNGLSKRCHDLVNDLLVISRNLGYESDGVTSYHHDWNPGKKKNFYLKNGDIAFTAKGYIKGTMHFQINQDIMLAMNVEFGRLKGWLKDKRQAAEELGISEAEAEKAWGSLGPLLPPVPSMMLDM